MNTEQIANTAESGQSELTGGLGCALPMEQLRAAVAQLQKNAVPPLVILTAKEARAMTKKDPAGHQWKVGEKYYRAEYVGGQFAFPVQPNA